MRKPNPRMVTKDAKPKPANQNFGITNVACVNFPKCRRAATTCTMGVWSCDKHVPKPKPAKPVGTIEIIRRGTQLRDSMKSGALREAIKQAAKEPVRMKPWKGWCVVRHGAPTTDASKSRWPLLDTGIARDERVVRVLVTELGAPHPDAAKVEAVRKLCNSFIGSGHANTWGETFARDILRILSAKGAKR